MKALACVVVMALTALAPAAARADFIGPYAPGNWTISLGAGDGSVDTSGAPSAIAITGANNAAIQVDTDFTIAAVADGNWSFHFAWDNQDSAAGTQPNFDFGGFLLNGAFTPYGGADAAGNQAPIPVLAGDIIGFRVHCSDCKFGPGVLTITEFSAPTIESVPEPNTLILTTLGAAGLAAAHRWRRLQR